MMYRACMFDLDGTLLNTISALTYATNMTLKALGLSQITPEQTRRFVGDGYRMQMERALLACKDETLSRLDEALPLYMENFSKYCMMDVVPYDGIGHMLEFLKKCKVKLAVFSNKPHIQAVECVETIFGKGYFDVIRGEQPGTPKKPAPDGALLILKELGMKPGECLYVGDTNTDMQTGIAAGMDTAGVTWGFRDREELACFSPKFIVEHPVEIEEIVTLGKGDKMTKIDIISGFLGAGKTTFIKQLLKEAVKGEKVVLIENEFGEIGIDGGFLEDAGIEIREMNSGCICCSLVGDFGRSLEEVLIKYRPDRVLIEPSGVGKLSDVVTAVKAAASKSSVKQNSAVTVVDVSKCRMYMKNFGEFFNNQIENAGTIVLSRTDITNPDKVQAVVDLLREHNQKAAIVTTPCSELSGGQLLELIEKNDDMAEKMMVEVKAQELGPDPDHHNSHRGHGGECSCGDHIHEENDHGCGCHGHEENDHECGCHGHEESDHECGCHGHEESDHGCGCQDGHHHDHHADEVFTSWGRENVTGISRERLEEILHELAFSKKYGEVLRAKGMVSSCEGGSWLHFDVVPQQAEIREGAPSYTGKVCVIGAELDEAALAKAFNM